LELLKFRLHIRLNFWNWIRCSWRIFKRLRFKIWFNIWEL